VPRPSRARAAASLHRPAAEIADCADTVGGLHRAAAEYDGRQPGDPAKAAEVIRNLAADEAPPIRVQPPCG